MKNHIFKKIFSIIIFFVLAAVIVYNTVIIIKTAAEPGKTPDFLGIKTYIILSGSMEPELTVGDMIIVKEVDEDKLNVGDIISYRDGANVVTHRIIKIDTINGTKQFITKGDHNNVEDRGALTIASVEGKIIGKVAYIGKFILFLKNKYVLIILAVVSFLCFFKRKSKEL